ncbi:MAG: DUF1593 domain-containing protein, partial [Planctomycetes bacterium]|nr:DUF1593 domain-containing protein [Planctomycetota bacterium]
MTVTRTLRCAWLLCCCAALALTAERPRLLVTTDIGGDPDDQQAMVRLMTYANDVDIEALIASAAGTLGELATAVVRPDLITQIVDGYGAVQPNLLQHDSRYPSAATLRARVTAGNPNRGMTNVGAGRDTAGSNAIIAAADRADARPLAVAIWGGQTDLAQALWRVRNDRTSAQLAAFVAKLRVHDISDQDGIAWWITGNFPDLFYILSLSQDGNRLNSVYRGMFLGGDLSLVTKSWIDTHVKNGHGALGALYPRDGLWTGNGIDGVKDGDSPSWFYVLRNGLNDPAQPGWGGWGGRFQREGAVWRDAQDSVNGETSRIATVWRWRQAYQNDFQSRMDWCFKPYSGANHQPRALLNGVGGTDVVQLSVVAGARVDLSASGTSDPDGQALSYRWFQYREAGSHAGSVALDGAANVSTWFTAPQVTTTRTVHVIIEVKDTGSPALYAFRRAVVTVTPEVTPPPPPTTAPIAHWRMDDTGSIASDSSGNGNHATLRNGVRWGVGASAGALACDGIDDLAAAGNPAILRLTGAMSTAAWVWIDSVGSNGRVVCKQGPNGQRGWSLNVESGGYASFQIASSSTSLMLVDSGAVPRARWVHLAGVYEPGVAMRLYVNGALAASRTSGVPSAQYDPPIDVAIGNRIGGGTPFAGRIDDVRIYARPLSASEVAALASVGTSGFAASINFQPAGAATPTGSVADTGASFAARGNGLDYGWNTTNDQARERNAHGDQRYDTLNHLQKASGMTWEIAVPNGTYEVRLVCGDAGFTDQVNHILIEGMLASDGDGADAFDEHSVTVPVNDGRLTVRAATQAVNAKVCF